MPQIPPKKCTATASTTSSSFLRTIKSDAQTYKTPATTPMTRDTPISTNAAPPEELTRAVRIPLIIRAGRTRLRSRYISIQTTVIPPRQPESAVTRPTRATVIKCSSASVRTLPQLNPNHPYHMSMPPIT